LSIDAALDIVRGATALSADVRAMFVDRANQALERLALVRGNETDVPIHGDASIENVVARGSEQLFIDFEVSGTGPGAYDLAPIQTRARRFGGPLKASESVLQAHGSVAMPMNDAMVRLHEVLIICGAIVPHMERSARFRDEFVLRVTTLNDPDGATWTPHLRLLENFRP
jgi:Ser/Thr protein kinase RdoA (MazF antagonist)